MFEHLVRDGVILFLSGVTILTKIVPALRIKKFTDKAVGTVLGVAWLLTVVGFISMCAGVAVNSW